MPANLAAAVLLVDRDPETGREIMAYLADPGYSVEWVDDGEKAFNRLDTHHFDVLITGLHVRRGDGMRLMSVAKERNPEVCVIIIADHPDIELATEAMRQGAYDFQIRPVNLQKLDAVIQRGIAHQSLVLEKHELRRRLDEQYGFANLVGNSRQMVKVCNAVRKAAPASMPVLIRGESGVGKDLIALAIHNNSSRCDEPFVKLECSGMPRGRLEVELFGSSLDGSEMRRGRIEIADRGTLFIDDVAELDERHQKGILRVIKQGKMQRPGESRAMRVDTRIIAAASRPIDRNKMIEGLYDLLHAATIDVPPLRERREDIPLLVHHFMRDASRVSGAPVTGISQNGLDLLMRYDWPGNVRELKNIVDGMIVMATGNRPLDVKDIPEHVRQAAGPRTKEIRIPVGSTMSDIERMVIEETLKALGYRKGACAKMLGIGLRTLYRKLKEYETR
jgi:DNA-binding NtrC family response regulator